MRFRTLAEAEAYAKKAVAKRQGGWSLVFNGKTLEKRIDFTSDPEDWK
jgi:hypothetical protein